jgi:hypothetical protein
MIFGPIWAYYDAIIARRKPHLRLHVRDDSYGGREWCVQQGKHRTFWSGYSWLAITFASNQWFYNRMESSNGSTSPK